MSKPPEAPRKTRQVDLLIGVVLFLVLLIGLITLIETCGEEVIPPLAPWQEGVEAWPDFRATPSRGLEGQ